METTLSCRSERKRQMRKKEDDVWERDKGNTGGKYWRSLGIQMKRRDRGERETVSAREETRERTWDSIFITVALTDPHQEGASFVLWTQKQLLSLLSVYIPIVPSVKQMHITQLNEWIHQNLSRLYPGHSSPAKSKESFQSIFIHYIQCFAFN